MQADSTHPGKAAYASALMAVVLWSSSYTTILYGLRAFTPGEIAFMRFLVASLAFAVPVAMGAIRLPPPRDWPAVVLLAAIGHAAYQLCLGYAMTRITAGTTSVALALVPGVTAALAALRLKERLPVRALAGLGIAFTGTLCVVLGRGNRIHPAPAAWLVYLGVLCVSAYFVFQKPLLARTGALGFTAASMMAAAVLLLPFGARLPAKLAAAPPALMAAMLYLGLLPTVAGFYAWSWALARAPASRVSSFMYLTPVCGCLIAWLWLAEMPTWLVLAGGFLAVTGVVVATVDEGFLRRIQRRRKAPA